MSRKLSQLFYCCFLLLFCPMESSVEPPRDCSYIRLLCVYWYSCFLVFQWPMVSWNSLKLNTPKGSLALLPYVCSECLHSFTVRQSRLTWSPLCNCISFLPSCYEEIPGRGSPKRGGFTLVHSLRAESIVLRRDFMIAGAWCSWSSCISSPAAERNERWCLFSFSFLLNSWSSPRNDAAALGGSSHYS